jgi:signal transduction histidine kinase
MIMLFCAAVGILLASSFSSFYLLFRREVRLQTEHQLLETVLPVIADLISEPDAHDVKLLNVPGQFFELLDDSGVILEESVNLRGHRLNVTHTPRRTGPQFSRVQDDFTGELSLVVVPFERGHMHVFLALGIPASRAQQSLITFRRAIGFLLPLNLMLLWILSNWYVQRILRPISMLTKHAADAAQRVGHPARLAVAKALPVVNPHDELGRLAYTFNQLFAKVDALVSQMRQFVTDASHELRTPLAVLRGETELVLSEDRSNEEYQNSLRIIEDELEKLIRIVEALFTLSIADAGQLRLAEEPLYLNEVLEEACAMVAAHALARSIQIRFLAIRKVLYLGDEAILRQLCVIFLDNALKYSDGSTVISVGLAVVDNSIRLSFEDQGIGISEENQERLFERFYRVTNSFAGEAQSGGLGLAIAKVIAEAHGGSIECRSTLGCGSTFTVVLPYRDRVIDYSPSQESPLSEPNPIYNPLTN